jgi:putative salt-induced outer membrane protein YdiY
MKSTLRAAAILAICSAVLPVSGAGQTVWENATEFAFVTTSGNASSTTLGLQSELNGKSEVSSFKVELGGIRASSNFRTRTAVGTPGSFVVNEMTRTERSAANYFVRSRFDQDLGENDFFVFAGAGWARNTFAGFNNRFSFVAGVGDAWIDDETTLFKTDIGGTYTIQKDIEPTAGRGDGFGGVRATVEFTRALSETTDLELNVVADENLQNTEDLRIDWQTSLSVSLTEGLAFKTSYQILFDNDPALVGVPLFDGGGTPAGVNVLVPSQDIDTFLTLSLVIKL